MLEPTFGEVVNGYSVARLLRKKYERLGYFPTENLTFYSVFEFFMFCHVLCNLCVLSVWFAVLALTMVLISIWI